MSHNELRKSWIKEGTFGLGTGILYGLTSVAVGQPFDTIKTKMQAQKGFEHLSTWHTLKAILRTDGMRGLYRGCIPPLLGSGIYRSIQFSGFEAVYTLMDDIHGKTQVPFTCGIQSRVIFGGLMAASLRSIIETPLEYAKVKRQVGKDWHLKDMFTGLRITWMRSLALVPSYFLCLDSFRRHFPSIFTTPIVGHFLAGGLAANIAWTIAWPLEYSRCQIQAGYLEEKRMTITQRLRYIVNERGGFFGLYRGLSPGLYRSFLANGCAMVVMQYAQKKVSEHGLRD